MYKITIIANNKNGDKMKENLNALDELNKGATMGMDAINFVLDKVEDDEFKKTLELEYNKYKDISRRANELYKEYSSDEPHETNAMNKAMTWSSVQMKTMTDKSNSKIAELLIQGTNMGIIEGRKLLNNKEIDKEVNKLISEFVTMQEDSVEKLKTYL